MSVTQTLSGFPSIPSPSRPETFDGETDAFLGHFPTFETELTNITDQINLTEANINAKEASAVTAAADAVAASTMVSETALAAMAATNASPYDAVALYSYPECTVDDDGYTYRCMGVNVTNTKPSTNSALGGAWLNLSISGAAGNVMVDESAIGDKKTLLYDLASGKLTYSLPALAALSDVPTASAGTFLRRSADDTAFYWSDIALTDTGVPAPVAGKYLRRKEDDTGYEWTDMIIGSAIEQIALDIQKPYTDTTSLYTIMETDGYPDMIAYKEAFKTWFTTGSNPVYIDPAQSQNVFDNVMRSAKALAVLFSIGEGHDWLIARISDATYQSYMTAAISTLGLGRDVTFHSSDKPTVETEYAISLTPNNGSYAWVKAVSVYSNYTYGTSYLRTEISGNVFIATPQISATATSVTQNYTPNEYGTTMISSSTASAFLYTNETNYTHTYDATISVLDRPANFLSTSATPAGDYPADCTTWACKVSYDLGLPYTEAGSFASRIANDTTGNLVEYISAFNTLIADPLFSAMMSPGNNIHNNIFNTLYVANAVLHNSGIVDYLHAHSNDATIGTYIDAAIAGAYVSTVSVVAATTTSTGQVTVDIPAGVLGFVSNAYAQSNTTSSTPTTHSAYDGTAGSGTQLYTESHNVTSMSQYSYVYTFSSAPIKGTHVRSIRSSSGSPAYAQAYTRFTYII